MLCTGAETGPRSCACVVDSIACGVKCPWCTMSWCVSFVLCEPCRVRPPCSSSSSARRDRSSFISCAAWSCLSEGSRVSPVCGCLVVLLREPLTCGREPSESDSKSDKSSSSIFRTRGGAFRATAFGNLDGGKEGCPGKNDALATDGLRGGASVEAEGSVGVGATCQSASWFGSPRASRVACPTAGPPLACSEGGLRTLREWREAGGR